MLSALDLTAALPAAHAAIDLAVEHVLSHPPRNIRYKGDRNPVSEVDETVEHLVRQRLSARGHAEIGFVGEETGAVGNPETYWVLDPIDGTINHQHANPLCAIALGLVHHDQPVLGVTALPFLGHRYWAAHGHGAYRDGDPISASTDLLNKALVGFSDYGSGTDEGLRDLLCAAVDRELTARAQGLRRYGSSALDLVWVADGTLDACVLLGNHTWDTAAGAIIAREAGALVLDADGSPHSTRSRCAIAMTQGLQDEVLPLLRVLRGSRFWPDNNEPDAARVLLASGVTDEDSRARAMRTLCGEPPDSCHASRSWQGLILIELGSAHVRSGSTATSDRSSPMIRSNAASASARSWWKHPRSDPLIATGSRRGVRDPVFEDCFDVDLRRPRGEADQDSPEHQPVGHPWPVAAKRVDCRNSGVAAHRPMLTWPMGLRSEATHGRDLISRRVTG